MLDPKYVKSRYKNYSPTRKRQQKSIDYTNFDKPYTIDTKLKVIGVLKPDQREEADISEKRNLINQGIVQVMRAYSDTV